MAGGTSNTMPFKTFADAAFGICALQRRVPVPASRCGTIDVALEVLVRRVGDLVRTRAAGPLHAWCFAHLHVWLTVPAGHPLPPRPASARDIQADVPLASLIDTTLLVKSLGLHGSTSTYPEGFIADFGAHARAEASIPSELAWRC